MRMARRKAAWSSIFSAAGAPQLAQPWRRTVPDRLHHSPARSPNQLRVRKWHFAKPRVPQKHCVCSSWSAGVGAGYVRLFSRSIKARTIGREQGLDSMIFAADHHEVVERCTCKCNAPCVRGGCATGCVQLTPHSTASCCLMRCACVRRVQTCPPSDQPRRRLLKRFLFELHFARAE